MSIKNWNAGIIRPVAVAPAGPYATGAAPGVWTLDQQAFWQKQGLWPIAGNNLYIEDVFSTYLYTGTGASQTISNGVDLSTKGGMVWIKSRSAATNNFLFDTSRGTTKEINSNTTDAEATLANSLTAFNTDGFTVNSATGIGVNAATYTSWTFRKQAKFFDVVTYTGNGANRTIAHNLGSVPGCIIVKRTDTTGAWQVYHRSLANTEYLVLNTTAAKATGATRWNSTTPTSTEFSLGTDATVNANSGTYVAYIFAHDAGGFGLTGTDNVISCGSVSVASGTSNAVVNLGYEPQWVLWRNADVTDNWYIFDNMRGIGAFNTAQQLNPNLSDAESAIGSSTYPINITSTGFSFNAGNFGWGASSNKFIYIAIRRGPMKTPTSGTSVFAMDTYRATSPALVSGFITDWSFRRLKNTTSDWTVSSRLSGNNYLLFNSTAAEASGTTEIYSYQNGAISSVGSAFSDLPGWLFRRAPGFFDVVCYTGTGANTTQTHNLGVVPELMIVKGRSDATAWQVYASGLANTEYLVLNTTAAKATGATRWNSTTPTSTVFSLGTASEVNTSSATYVAYLFASCPGVSKVGSYTGSGTTKQIDCGFTGGARFVLIKRTDSTGDWYVWDSARGIVAGNDPYLLLNSTAAEVTGTDYVDTYSAGFEISSTAPAAINANGGSFIFLAIA